MKGTKRNILISAILAIAMSVSLIVGATFALFTDKSEVNISVTSGKVEVVATIDTDSVQTKQLNTEYESGLNGTFAQNVSISDGEIELDKCVPGDGIKFNINIENKSNVKAKYRTKWATVNDNGLLSGLTVKVGGEIYDGTTLFGNWTELDADAEIAPVEVEILLGEDKGNEYQSKTCKLAFLVEAVQGNAETIDNNEENVTYVYNVYDFKNFRDKVNNGNNFSRKTVKLMADIDLNNEAWTPIGCEGHAFSGTFDGNGKTITNLNVTATDYSGLFGIMHGVVKNLTVESATVKGNHYCGVIAAYSTANSGGISDCTVKNANVHTVPEWVESNNSYDNGDKAGGIIGYIAYGSYITGCTVVDSEIRGYRDLGGIVGCALGNGNGLQVTDNTVKNVNILQDNTNAYKDKVTTYEIFIGRFDEKTDMTGNTYEGVTLKSVLADGFYGVKNSETGKVEYQISNANGLRYLATVVNKGTSYNGETIKLVADIDLNNEEWTPIGGAPYDGNTYTKPFSGTFDGNGKTISNLSISKSGMCDVGLFGYTTNGVVKNFTLNNANVKGYLDVGAVAGTPYSTKYENIKLTGDVKVNGYAYVGGMFGKNAYANLTNLTIDVDEGSYVKADSTKKYRTYVGGLVGFMGEGSQVVSDITSNINVIGSTCDVGGITGMAHYGNTFKNITCTGNVTLEGASDSGDELEIGGIAGVWHNENGHNVTFENCTFRGALKSTNVNTGEVTEFPHNGLIGRKYGAGTGKLIIDGVEQDA